MKCHVQRIVFAALAALVLLAGAGVTPARADNMGTLHIDGFLFDQGGTFNSDNSKNGDIVMGIQVTGPNGTYSGDAYTGIIRSQLSGLTNALGAYSPGNSYDIVHVCDEITQDVFLGSSYTYDIKPLSDPGFPAPYQVGGNSQANAGEIGGVVNDFLNVSANSSYAIGLNGNSLTKITDATQQKEWSAATQIAVWDLSYDGYFSVTSGDSQVVTDANEILAYEKTHSDLSDAVWLHSASAQDQILRVPAVPEPGFVQLAVLLGLGGLGFLRKRRGLGLRSGLALAI